MWYGKPFIDIRVRVIILTYLLRLTTQNIFPHEEHDLAVATEFRVIFNLFQGCHFKFIFIEGDKPAHFSQKVLSTFDKIVEAMQNKVTYSTQTKWHSYHRRHPDRLNSTSSQTCAVFVYVYSQEEFASHQKSLDSLRTTINGLIVYDIWANHVLLLGKLLRSPTPDDKQITYLEHSKHLLQSNLRGIVMFFDYQSVYLSLVCFPCSFDGSTIFNLINLKTVPSLKDLGRLSDELNSNFRQGHLPSGTKQGGILPSISPFCNFHIPNPNFSDRNDTTENDCILEVLGHKLNYTFAYYIDSTRNRIYASEFPMVGPNLKDLASTNRISSAAIVISAHLYFSDYLKLIIYHPRPRSTIQAFLNPYTTWIWVIFVFSITIATFIASLCPRLASLKFRIYPQILNLLVSVLDQRIALNAKRSPGSTMCTKYIPTWLCLCLLAMVALNAFYKGTIYSFISKVGPTESPPPTNDIIHDPSYLKLAVTATIKSKTERFRDSALLMLSQTPWFFDQVDLLGLRQNLCFRDEYDFLCHIGDNNSFIQDASYLFDCNHQQYSKLALLEFSREGGEIDLFLKYLHSRLLTFGRPRVISSVVVRWGWIMRRNFFTELFTTGLGRLSQSGYPGRIEKRFFKLVACNNLIKLVMTRNLSISSNPIARCYYIIDSGNDPDVQDKRVKAVSWQQLQTIFLILLLISPGLMLLFVAEIC